VTEIEPIQWAYLSKISCFQNISSSVKYRVSRIFQVHGLQMPINSCMQKSGSQCRKYSAGKCGANNGVNFKFKINTFGKDAPWEQAKSMAEKLGGQYCHVTTNSGFLIGWLDLLPPYLQLQPIITAHKQ
jgi:hypothetical protein